jgi:hypothetical protein
MVITLRHRRIQNPQPFMNLLYSIQFTPLPLLSEVLVSFFEYLINPGTGGAESLEDGLAPHKA